jgi:hypothetical protein
MEHENKNMRRSLICAGLAMLQQFMVKTKLDIGHTALQTLDQLKLLYQVLVS